MQLRFRFKSKTQQKVHKSLKEALLKIGLNDEFFGSRCEGLNKQNLSMLKNKHKAKKKEPTKE